MTHVHAPLAELAEVPVELGDGVAEVLVPAEPGEVAVELLGDGSAEVLVPVESGEVAAELPADLGDGFAEIPVERGDAGPEGWLAR